MNRNAALNDGQDLPFSDWAVAVVMSILIHCVVCIGIVIFTHSFSETYTPISAIDVDLAFLPASKGTPDAKGGAPGPEKPVSTPEPESPPAEEITEPEKVVKPQKMVEPQKDAVSLKKDLKKDKKKVPDKKEPSEQDIINSAIKRLEKNMGKPRPDPLAARLKALAAETGEGSGPRGNGGTDEGDQAESGLNASLIDRYRIFVINQVRDNWAFSQHLTGGRKNLGAKVSFEVLPDGEIRDVKITKRSGNDYMDSAATMAVLKSSPVRPHPPGINRPYIEVRITFAPHEVN